MALPPEQMMPEFVRVQLAPGVEPPSPPQGPPPPWMATRPAGLNAFTRAFKIFPIDVEQLRAFDHPVLYTIGGRSNPIATRFPAERLSRIFPDFTLEVFEERHHFDPPHRVEPDRYARSLRKLWNRASGMAKITGSMPP